MTAELERLNHTEPATEPRPLNFLSVNAEGAFGDPERWQAAVKFVKDQNPDVAFLGESNWELPVEDSPEGVATARNELIVQESVLALRALGYQVLRNSDNDKKLDPNASQRPDRTGWMGLVRVVGGVGCGAVIRMGTRDAYLADVMDPITGKLVRVVGQHFDDRNEPLRLGHVQDLPPDTDVLMGDLNSMHGEDTLARVLRTRPLRWIANKIPDWDYDFTAALANPPAEKANKLLHLAKHLPKTALHLCKRLVGMATGEVMRTLAERGFTDADPAHQQTMAGRLPVQLDHIMTGERVGASNFTVHKETGFTSDHFPISATIRVKQDA